jgi:hypothetical protein
MVMNNKKGWIRIIEALVAILLIAGFLSLIIVDTGNGEKDISSKAYSAENAILREVQLNSSYRNYILTVDDSIELEDPGFDEDLRDHISSRYPMYLECTSKICDLDTDPVCNIVSLDENIYVRSIIIAANQDDYDPKILKLFCWTQE